MFSKWRWTAWAVAVGIGVTGSIGSAQVSDLILGDQFGWRADSDSKVAVFADPQSGQNSAQSYSAGSTFEIRRTSDNVSVHSGSITQWNSGATHSDSGDKAWLADFSALTTPGEYYVYDVGTGLRSHPFRIHADVYNEVLMHACRMFFYNRRGTEITSRHGGYWTHPLSHTQDLTAQLMVGGVAQGAGTARDVSKGWFDAGDYNKYVHWTGPVLWEIMTAYELNPGVFTDATVIPESANGVPDILDEVRWELEWLLKMQDTDGGVFNRVGAVNFDDGNASPATDTRNQHYTPKTTWATASFAASMAQAARVYQPFDSDFATTLSQAAQDAWGYLEDNTSMSPASGSDGGGLGGATDSVSNTAEDMRLRILAAAQLYRLLGTSTYKDFFEDNYRNTAYGQNGVHPESSSFLDPTNHSQLTQAMFTYCMTPGADTTEVNRIKGWVLNLMDWIILPAYNNPDDPYHSFMWTGHYSWGSNGAKAKWGAMALWAKHLQVRPADDDTFEAIAEHYLNYFHGRNPLGYVWLSNMGTKGAKAGAEKSPLEIYHGWFEDGSAAYDGAASTYGPAPGYVVGGPNNYFSQAISPPQGEPPMKAYRDWNTGWPDSSWEITEPAIYYQSAYVFLASHFATSAGAEIAEAPSAATLDSPAAGATDVLRAADLEWTSGRFTEEFEVYLDTNPSPTTLAGTVTTESFDPGTLAANTTYYWKVVSKNGTGSVDSSIRSFTTGASVPVNLSAFGIE